MALRCHFPFSIVFTSLQNVFTSLRRFFTSLHQFLNFPSGFLFYFLSPFYFSSEFSFTFLHHFLYIRSPYSPSDFFFLHFSIFKRILLSFSFFKLFLLFFGIFIVSFLIFKYRRKRNCVNFLLDKKFLKRISKPSLGHV